jgi:hypothetical protein
VVPTCEEVGGTTFQQMQLSWNNRLGLWHLSLEQCGWKTLLGRQAHMHQGLTLPDYETHQRWELVMTEGGNATSRVVMRTVRRPSEWTWAA